MNGIIINKTILFACLFMSSSVLAASQKFVAPTEKERIKICADVKAGNFEEIQMITVQEAGLDAEKMKIAEKDILEWHIDYDKSAVVFGDYDNNGVEDILVYGEYTSGAGSGCDLYAFVVYDKEKNVFSVLSGNQMGGSGYNVSCRGGGQRLIKYKDMYLIKILTVEPRYANWQVLHPLGKNVDYYKNNSGKMDGLANYYWNVATYLDGTHSDGEILGRNIFCTSK